MIILILILVVLALFLVSPMLFLAGGKMFRVKDLTFKKALIVAVLLALISIFLIVLDLFFLKSSSDCQTSLLAALLFSIVSISIGIYLIKTKFGTTIPRSIGIILFHDLIILLLVLGGVNGFVVQSYCIPSGGMADTILIGDHVLVNKFYYRFKEPIRKDIIAFTPPHEPSQEYLKRVIGMPGEVIEIRDKKVTINQKPLDEGYAIFKDPDILPGGNTDRNKRDNFGPVTVPPGSYFVLGDNRDYSHDSRFFGFVKRDSITGKLDSIYYSLEGFSKEIRWDRIGRTIK